ncbi:MAG TPA: C40 family peptidase [Gaiellaceae bacterium]|jgi:cell wall-associated NlpC family hydrolase|nr:C40 family peptidase [Gaiellaceae bacterium]
MTERIRFALLILVVVACVAARAGGALGASTHVTHVSRATAIAHEQKRLVRFARHYLGVRYVYGGTSPAGGFDCSGFTRFVYAHFGISLPHYSGSQFDRGRRVSRAGLRPGDLVFFDGLGHVGIYIGRDRFIHAPHTGTDVEIDTLSGWYGTRYDGARRLL